MFRDLVLCAVFVCIASNPTYRDKIPNGYYVKDPCNSNLIWEAVGHNNPYHGGVGQLNLFGRRKDTFGNGAYIMRKLTMNDFSAFRANNDIWDTTLCQMDSDGDGDSNGKELGDPDCTWKEGELLGDPPGHPGLNKFTHVCN